MITFTTGDIFEAQTEAIVNTVNLMGVMGKGIALQFKERFKNNYKIYRSACEEHTIDIGKLLTVKAQWQGRDIFIINFPTKKHWRNPSEYSFVEAGLDDLVRVIEQYGIKSIAIPPLGAGNGKLDWKEVRRIISLKYSDSLLLFLIQATWLPKQLSPEILLTLLLQVTATPLFGFGVLLQW